MTNSAPALRLDANLSWLFTEVPFPQRFDAAAAAGFAGVECGSLFGHPAVEVRAWLDQAGVELVLLNSDPGPTGYGSACRPDQVTEFRAGFERTLDDAITLRSKLIHLMAGVCPAELERKLALATYLDNVSWAAAQVAGTGIEVALELINQRDAPGFVLHTIEEAAGVVAEVAAADVGLQFDFYHVQVSQGDLTTRLRTLLPLIKHIQVADPPTRSEPGTGEIGWRFLFDELRTLRYPGWIGCEYRPVAGTLPGLGWRERHLA